MELLTYGHAVQEIGGLDPNHGIIVVFHPTRQYATYYKFYICLELVPMVNQ